MIAINYTQGNTFFEINDKRYAQVYQAVAMGETHIAIYSVHDIKNQLLPTTPITDVKVNGTTYTNQKDLITNLIDILYQSGTGNSIGGGGGTDWQTIIDTKEDKFTKNTAFNKNFGSSTNQVVEGNDPRFAMGTTAYGWGDHNQVGYLKPEALPTIIDALNSNDIEAALSANQGRVLKQYVDDINALLTSDDTSLDEIQEIVNYIKQNKSELQNLGITNIAGLQSALDGLTNQIDTHSHSWSQITAKPTTFPATAHQHPWTDITGKPSTFNPSPHTHDDRYFIKSEVDNKLDLKSDKTHQHSWTDINGKPITFPPSVHNHDDRYYTEGEIDGKLDLKSDKTHSHSWSQITSKPTTFTPSPHDHNHLYSALGHTHAWGEITSKPSFPNNYVESLSFNTSARSLTLNRSGLSAISVSLSGGFVDGGSFSSTSSELTLTRGGLTPYIIDLSSLTNVSPTWNSITGKPTTFNPSPHDHNHLYAPITHSHSWSSITSKPTIPTNNNQLTNGKGYINGIQASRIFINPLDLPSNYTKSDVRAYLNSNGFAIPKGHLTIVDIGEGVYASGGNSVYEITEGGNNYRVHVFTSSGTFIINSGIVDYLIVAGGGSGGTSTNSVRAGGGGGAGGYLSGSAVNISGGTYTVTVGSGGVKTPATSGGNSSFLNKTAIGGGYGGHGDNGQFAGDDGGSGGGAGSNNSTVYSSGVSGQGHAGGMAGVGIGRGGGGAGSVGGTAGSSESGLGGAGKTSTITGTSTTYAIGGRGGGSANASSNTGSGGGGGYSFNTGGSGGSGIVIIRYRI